MSLSVTRPLPPLLVVMVTAELAVVPVTFRSQLAPVFDHFAQARSGESKRDRGTIGVFEGERRTAAAAEPYQTAI